MNGFRVPRLPRNVALVDERGNPTKVFQQWWQSTAEMIEGQERRQDELLDAIVKAQEAAAAAQTAAETATTAAGSAQEAANNAQTAAGDAGGAATVAQKMAALSNSGVIGGTISAMTFGSDAEIAVSAHTRVYGDGRTVPVNSGTVSLLSPATNYYIGYEDPARAGGSVSYMATTDEGAAAQVGDWHLVGEVFTPEQDGPPVSGTTTRAPGLSSL